LDAYHTHVTVWHRLDTCKFPNPYVNARFQHELLRIAFAAEKLRPIGV
jgi:hypothetical protein